MPEPIVIHGLKETVAALRAIDPGFRKQVRGTMRTAAQTLRDRARPGVPVGPKTKRRNMRNQPTQSARQSIRVGRTSELSAEVRAGGDKAMHYPWLDFGGKRRGRGGGIAVRPFYADGRYLYATYYEMRESGELVEMMQKDLIVTLHLAGLQVEVGG